MATKRPPNAAAGRADSEDEADPPRLRLRLASIDDVRRELARLYREGKAGRRDVGDVSRLANVLQILGRMIEGADLESRTEALETELQRLQQAREGARWPAPH